MTGLLLALALTTGAPQFEAKLPKRPLDMWVFRSVLDKQARMVTIALSEDLWVAYDATDCGLYKVWKGGVKFDGAVYTAAHGPQPTTQGQRYQSGFDGPVWTIAKGNERKPAKMRFRGYRFELGQVVLQYDTTGFDGETIRIEEIPEYYRRNDRPSLIRTFKVRGLTASTQLYLKTRIESIGDPREFITQTDFIRQDTKQVTVAGRETLAITGEVKFEYDADEVKRAGFVLGTIAVSYLPALPETKLFAQSPDAAIDGAEYATESPEPAVQAPTEPGVAVRVYDVRENMDRLPTLVPSQTPNRSFVAKQVNFRRKAEFGEVSDQYLAHLTGFLNITTPGKYEFRLTSDDGSMFWIRDTLVVSNDGLHSEAGADGTFEMNPGAQPFRIEYFDNGGDSVLRLEWKRPGTNSFELVPESAFITPSGEVRVTSPGKKNIIQAGSANRPGDQRPLDGVHPSYDLITIRPKDFKPRVGGIDFLPDGRMVICTWDAEGAVYVISGVRGDASNVRVKKIAQGLAEPLGIKVVGKDIYVLQKQELTKLIDRNGDEVTDEYYAVANGWGVTDNFHEFAFGLVYDKGYFYANLAIAIDPGGASTQPQNPDRGKVVKIDANTGDYEFVASGLRTPNGIGFGYQNEIFITDNQGDWLPSSKLLHFKPGAFFGSRAVDPKGTANLKEQPPVVWLPQGEIGNSPSQPTIMKDGPYRGQMLHGDVTHGGLKRVFVERVNGQLQGAVYRFTQGLEAGINRVAWGPDGGLYVGGIGATGNWGQEGKERFGLQKLRYNGKPTFEILATRSRSNGFEVELTRPLREDVTLDASHITITRYKYVPTATYGGPKVDERILQPKHIWTSLDRKRVNVQLDELKPGYVYYFRFDPTLTSAQGDNLWSTESWYTLNQIPKVALPVYMGPRLKFEPGFDDLFDGKSLDKWIGWKQSAVPKGWRIEDGLLTYTPGMGGGDLRTRDTFGDFDLRLEWRVQPGGNSGVMYRSSERLNAPYQTGPEYQLLDNARHRDGQSPLTSAGSNYALHPTDRNQCRPAGYWNETRIVARGPVIEHWLNGKLVVKYEINSADWKARLAKSKFARWEGYALEKAGHIVLQDHGDPIAFRNIRIRRY
ncbi:MAG: family 16 glycoside hydrolase [Fimbriimonadaceae bacterium]|nr:family 16 glycoside hydrolase [Fimbriimonadaceae bacterium]